MSTLRDSVLFAALADPTMPSSRVHVPRWTYHGRVLPG